MAIHNFLNSKALHVGCQGDKHMPHNVPYGQGSIYYAAPLTSSPGAQLLQPRYLAEGQGRQGDQWVSPWPSDSEEVRRALDSATSPIQHVGVDHGGLHAAVPRQLLDRRGSRERAATGKTHCQLQSQAARGYFLAKACGRCTRPCPSRRSLTSRSAAKCVRNATISRSPICARCRLPW